MSRRLKRLKIYWLILLLLSIVCVISACSGTVNTKLSDEEKISELEKWVSDKMDAHISFSSWSAYAGNWNQEKSEDSCYSVSFSVGDITFEQIYSMHYDYSRTFGWNLSEVRDVNTDEWSVQSNSLVDENRIVDDLEGQLYFSSYSNGQIEQRRVLSSEIISRECDASVGYDRVTTKIILNAYDVHEIVLAECEYLLDDEYKWCLFAKQITLDTVKVQSGVSDEIITEGLNSLTLYREEEDSTWSIGALNRLSYDIISRDLDSDNSQEMIEIDFRGEGTYMYITGTVLLDFRFSSGWYLYGSELVDNSCETGMLYDNWNLGKTRLIETIINEKPFTYEELSKMEITEDMLLDFNISEIRISENGRYQTAYFSYNIHINETDFIIDGYGKYELGSDGFLVLDTWNDTVDDISFDLSGVWYACDLNEDYLAYHTLVLSDSGSGILDGQITSYGVDLTGDTPVPFSTSCSLLGNISFGTSYQMFVESWSQNAGYKDLIIPEGEYDIVSDKLTYNNSRSDNCTFTKDQPVGRLSRKAIETSVEKGTINDLIEELIENK